MHECTAARVSYSWRWLRKLILHLLQNFVSWSKSWLDTPNRRSLVEPVIILFVVVWIHAWCGCGLRTVTFLYPIQSVRFLLSKRCQLVGFLARSAGNHIGRHFLNIWVLKCRINVSYAVVSGLRARRWCAIPGLGQHVIWEVVALPCNTSCERSQCCR